MKKKEDVFIGQRIKDIRASLNMDQKTFANIIGATVSALSNWENGRNKPNDIKLREISKIGNVPLPYLLEGSIQEQYYDKNINNQLVKLFQTSDIAERDNSIEAILDLLMTLNKKKEHDPEAFHSLLELLKLNTQSYHGFFNDGFLKTIKTEKNEEREKVFWDKATEEEAQKNIKDLINNTIDILEEYASKKTQETYHDN